MQQKNKVQNSYVINKDFIIIDVHPNWDKFLRENDGDRNTLSNNIKGKNIMEYIKGDSVKMWYESIINLAKNLGINITRPYRCDSHDKKRFMEMEVIPLRNGDILINHYIIKVEEVRDHINHPFLFGNIKGKETILRCSICNRFHYNNSWIEIEEAIKYYKFTNITISDIICNDCIKRELLEDKI